MPSRDSRDITVFKPGDLAPVSGVYSVHHLTRHRAAHHAVIIRGEELPVCRFCKNDVEFEVIQTASHVTHDWDFAGLSSMSVRRHAAEEFANLRTYPRHPMAMSLEVERTRKTAGLRGHVADISAGGVCAMLDDKLEPSDALVSLRINVPGRDNPLVLGGLMRYRYGNRHGFLFTDMDDSATQVVRRLVEVSRQQD